MRTDGFHTAILDTTRILFLSFTKRKQNRMSSPKRISLLYQTSSALGYLSFG